RRVQMVIFTLAEGLAHFGPTASCVENASVAEKRAAIAWLLMSWATTVSGGAAEARLDFGL
ncbi:MAG TPA: hypothetical protein VJA21_33765, partial [Verrucomicrobiae bacterium]